MKSLSQDIAARLQKMILEESQYEPEEKIPNERALASQLGVSRTSIREAIKILVGNGVLTVKRGVGTFVASTPDMGKDPLGLSGVEDKKKLVLDWYKVRLMVEPSEMEYVIDNITDEKLGRLRELQKKCEKLASSGEQYWDADTAFHKYLAVLSGNLILGRFMEGVSESVRMGTALGGILARENSVKNHKAIVDFIEKRDKAGAYHAMRMHLLLGMEEANRRL